MAQSRSANLVAEDLLASMHYGNPTSAPRSTVDTQSLTSAGDAAGTEQRKGVSGGKQQSKEAASKEKKKSRLSFQKRPTAKGDLNMSHLTKDMTALLDATDLLNKEGAQLKSGLTLPEVVVVGDQSDGKSTLLEAISGVRLPKGHGTCTRCPIRVSIRTADNESATIQGGYFAKEVSKLSQLDSLIREAQDSVAGDSKSKAPISATVICVSVKGPGLPNLTIVDLPGINRESGELENATVKLIHKWISREEAVIVVVAKAANDIAASKGYQMALEVDPDGERTILVLTNCDGSLTNKEEPLADLLRKHGDAIFAVKCFHQEGKTATREEVFMDEVQFFRQHPVFRNHVNSGTAAVIASLEFMLCDKLSPIQQDIVTKAKNLRLEIKREIDQMEAGLKGLASDFDTCIYAIRKEFEEEVTGSRRFQPHEFYGMCVKAWNDFGSKIIQISNELKKNLQQKVTEERKKQIGREHSKLTNNFPVMERIIKCLIAEFEPEVQLVVSQTQDIVTRALSTVVDDQLKRFKQLERIRGLRNLLCNFEKKDVYDEQAREFCTDILKMHESVLINNPFVERQLSDKFNEWPEETKPQSLLREDDADKKVDKSPSSMLLSVVGEIAKLVIDSRGAAIDLAAVAAKFSVHMFVVQSVMKFLQTHSSKTVSSQATGDFHEWEDEQRLLCLLYIYIDAVRDRVVDAIPMAIIHHVNRRLADKVCELVPSPTSDKLNELLERPERQREIQQLEERFKQWCAVLDRLKDP